MKKYNIAVVGATGAVGQEMINMLELRKFPVNNLYLYASARSKGKFLEFNKNKIKVQELTHNQIKNIGSFVDIALFSAGSVISKEYALKFVEQGVFVIDNSSAWRQEPDIPLVVPEVNSDELTKNKKLIANPNCSTIQMVVVLAPIHKKVKIKRIIVSTYQSVSGAGARAMHQLYVETKSLIKKLDKLKKITDINKNILIENTQRKILPSQIAFNLIPQIDVFLENNYTKEEMKMVNETKKILKCYNIKISATCVRVPVFRGHSESVWIELCKPLSLEEIKKILSESPGICVIDDTGKYPMPLDCAFNQITYVGRIRQDISKKNSFVMWIVSDNLLKGAALNAVEIAETLIRKNFV